MYYNPSDYLWTRAKDGTVVWKKSPTRRFKDRLIEKKAAKAVAAKNAQYKGDYFSF